MEIKVYQVSIKVVLQKDNSLLLLWDKETGYIDLPGGRIDEDEKDAPMDEIIDREMKEELGEDVKYEIGDLAFVYRYSLTKEGGIDVFVVAYEGKYLGGDVVLSDEHDKYEWVDPKTFVIKDEEVRGEYHKRVYSE